MVGKDKRDLHLLANSPFIISEQKVAFVISACFHTGHSVARQAAARTVAQEWLSPLAAETLPCGSDT